MKRKTLYNFNSVQLTFNHCVFNRIQYRTEHNLAVQYATRQFDWQLHWLFNRQLDWNSTDYLLLTTRLVSLTIRLAIQLYNSAYNSALQFRFTIRTLNFANNSAFQFRLQFVLSISSDEFVLTNSTYNWHYNNFGWPKWVKRSERPSGDSTVVQSGCLVSRPSLADVSRIGRSNGKGNPWQGQFLAFYYYDTL